MNASGRSHAGRSNNNTSGQISLPTGGPSLGSRCAVEVTHLVFGGEGLWVSSVFRTPTGQLRARRSRQLLGDLLRGVSSGHGERRGALSRRQPCSVCAPVAPCASLTASSPGCGTSPSFAHRLLFVRRLQRPPCHARRVRLLRGPACRAHAGRGEATADQVQNQ